MKNKADIKRDGHDVIVLDEKGREVYRQPKTAQTVSIAHRIYMCHKYEKPRTSTD